MSSLALPISSIPFKLFILSISLIRLVISTIKVDVVKANIPQESLLAIALDEEDCDLLSKRTKKRRADREQDRQ
jgi:hypothetical protein